MDAIITILVSIAVGALAAGVTAYVQSKVKHPFQKDLELFKAEVTNTLSNLTPRKHDVYALFFDEFVKLFVSNVSLEERENFERWAKTSKGVFMYGSKEIVDAYIKWKINATGPDNVRHFANLIAAIRRDLGHADNVSGRQFVQMFMKDELTDELAKQYNIAD